MMQSRAHAVRSGRLSTRSGAAAAERTIGSTQGRAARRGAVEVPFAHPKTPLGCSQSLPAIWTAKGEWGLTGRGLLGRPEPANCGASFTPSSVSEMESKRPCAASRARSVVPQQALFDAGSAQRDWNRRGGDVLRARSKVETRRGDEWARSKAGRNPKPLQASLRQKHPATRGRNFSHNLSRTWRSLFQPGRISAARAVPGQVIRND